MLAALRRRAKCMPGTSWLFGRAGSDRIDVVRGQATMLPVQQQPPRPAPIRSPRGASRIPAELPAELRTG
jgi:hypothetical protein